MTPPSIKRNLLWIVLGMTLLSQGVFVSLNLGAFHQRYRESIRANLQTAGSSLKENLDHILQKRIPLNRLSGLGALLAGFLEDVPAVGAVTIYDSDGQWRYFGNRQQFMTWREDAHTSEPPPTELTEVQVFELVGPQKQGVGKLVLAENEVLVRQTMGRITLDSITVILISMVAIIDLVLFLVAYTVTLPLGCAAQSINRLSLPEGQAEVFCHTGIRSLDRLLESVHHKRRQTKQVRGELRDQLSALVSTLEASRSWAGVDVGRITARLTHLRQLLTKAPDSSPPTSVGVFQNPIMIRPALFLFVFAEALATSFMPLYAHTLYRPLWGLSREIVIGLPISAFMLFSAISLPLAGALSDVIGRRKCFFAGALISLVGLLGCGMLADIGWLIALRALVGLGFGVVYMSVQGFVIDTTEEARRGEGLAMFLSALYAGSLCGTAIGGLIAERTGFQTLFLIGAGTVLAAMGFLSLFVRESQTMRQTAHKTGKSRLWTALGSTLPSPREFLDLLRDREFATLVVLQAIPSKIGLIGLVFYTAPLMLSHLGNNQSDIGRYVIGYSLMMIGLSQAVSRWSDQRENAPFCVVAGGIASGLVLIPFFWWQGTGMVIAGILGLGLAHTFVVSNQTKLASQLKAVQAVGVGSGMGLYTQCERVGNVLAPLVMGGLVASLGYAASLAAVGAYIALSSLLYGWLRRTAPRPVDPEARTK